MQHLGSEDQMERALRDLLTIRLEKKPDYLVQLQQLIGDMQTRLLHF